MAERQIDPERGAFPGLAFDLDLTSMRFHDLSRDPEAQSHPSVGLTRHRPLEAVEDLGPVLVAHPDPVIPNADPRVGRVGLDADLDRHALPELHRVGHEVRDDLVETGTIPCALDARRRLDPKLAAGPRSGVAETFDGLPRDARKVRLFRLQVEP